MQPGPGPCFSDTPRSPPRSFLARRIRRPCVEPRDCACRARTQTAVLPKCPHTRLSVCPVPQSSWQPASRWPARSPPWDNQATWLILESRWRPSQRKERRLPAALETGRRRCRAVSPARSHPLPGRPRTRPQHGMPSPRAPTWCTHVPHTRTDLPRHPRCTRTPHAHPRPALPNAASRTQGRRRADSPVQRRSLPVELPAGSVSPAAGSLAAGSPGGSAGSILKAALGKKAGSLRSEESAERDK